MLTNLWHKYTRFRGKYIIQQRRQYEYAVNRYYAHLIDPFFTKWVYDLKMSPNMVTILNGLIGIGAGISFLFQQWVLGAVFLQLHHFLDGADGNLARLTNRCTPLGAKLDQLSDQIVRLVVFVSLAISVDVALWAKLALPLTIFFDVWVIHKVVIPFFKKHTLIRARWKQWFLNRGIIPGIDIFTIFLILSVSAVLGWIAYAVYVIIILKNLDWMYRIWECIKTSYKNKNKDKNQQQITQE
jgi:phosphatidylglycerophosphate synthase